MAMISAEEARRLAQNAVNLEQIALEALGQYVLVAAAEKRTSLTLRANDFQKSNDLIETLTDLGYVVTTSEVVEGNWDITLDWSEQ